MMGQVQRRGWMGFKFFWEGGVVGVEMGMEKSERNRIKLDKLYRQTIFPAFVPKQITRLTRNYKSTVMDTNIVQTGTIGRNN